MLPLDSESWGDEEWGSYHRKAAKAIGCVYDPGEGDAVLAFFAALRHVKGRWGGQPFVLLPWQEHEIIRPFFGYLDKQTRKRRYRRAFIAVAKKNGKTAMCAGLALWGLFMENEPGAEVYSAAADIPQASLVFQSAAPMVRAEPDLNAWSKVLDTQKRIVFPQLNAFYQVLSAEVESKHGLSPSFVIFDELHAQPNRHLWDVLTQGAFAAREQPALFTITTAGYDRNSICFEEWEYARHVRDGIIEDPALLPVIYEVEEDDDWEDEETWRKANPSLGVTIKIEDMRAEYRKAKELPANENSFRRLRLNQWVSQETRFIPMSAWDACSADPLPFLNRAWYGGLDLSQTTDLTAWARVAFDDDGFLDIDVHGFLPAENIIDRENRDRVPYREWERQGFITLTPGNVIDYDVVRNMVDEDAYSDGKPVEIGFDRYCARQFCEIELPGMGFETFGVPQGPTSLNDPTRKLLELVLSGKVRHGGNPLLRWTAENVTVTQDSNGNIKPDKAKSTQRIDALAAVINAIQRALLHGEEQPSVYEERGILTF